MADVHCEFTIASLQSRVNLQTSLMLMSQSDPFVAVILSRERAKSSNLPVVRGTPASNGRKGGGPGGGASGGGKRNRV